MTDVIIMSSAADRRERLQRALDGAPALRLAGVASTLPFLRSLLDEASADVVVADLEALAGGADLRDWVRELLDLTSVVLLAPAPDPAMLRLLVRAGSGAMLRTDAPSSQIVRAVESVADGLILFDGSVVLPADSGLDTAEDLTPRETEVLHLLAEGFANREIAARMDISEHTIKFHIRSILAKLGASSRTEAVTRGLRAGLIEL
jgi:DNA-binding NarL/FixJ family response regulator